MHGNGQLTGELIADNRRIDGVDAGSKSIVRESVIHRVTGRSGRRPE